MNIKLILESFMCIQDCSQTKSCLLHLLAMWEQLSVTGKSWGMTGNHLKTSQEKQTNLAVWRLYKIPPVLALPLDWYEVKCEYVLEDKMLCKCKKIAGMQIAIWRFKDFSTQPWDIRNCGPKKINFYHNTVDSGDKLPGIWVVGCKLTIPVT